VLGRDGRPTGERLTAGELDLKANQVGYNRSIEFGDRSQAAFYSKKLNDPAAFEAALPLPPSNEYLYNT
jgi:hypothetical protein